MGVEVQGGARNPSPPPSCRAGGSGTHSPASSRYRPGLLPGAEPSPPAVTSASELGLTREGAGCGSARASPLFLPS